jgi:hypothetical protein
MAAAACSRATGTHSREQIHKRLVGELTLIGAEQARTASGPSTP